MFLWLLRLIRRLRYPGSRRYWERRYARGGHSGSGSQGEVAQYKARFLNGFVAEQGVLTVTELGCGDGQQLALATYPTYTGLDIAPSAISRCRQLFTGDLTKRFEVYDPEHFDPAIYKAELALSLEVIFHLTEENLYRQYLQHLFELSDQWVVVFAPNQDDSVTGGIYPHFKLRRWLSDVPSGWVLVKEEACPLQSVIRSSFWIFKKS